MAGDTTNQVTGMPEFAGNAAPDTAKTLNELSREIGARGTRLIGDRAARVAWAFKREHLLWFDTTENTEYIVRGGDWDLRFGREKFTSLGIDPPDGIFYPVGTLTRAPAESTAELVTSVAPGEVRITKNGEYMVQHLSSTDRDLTGMSAVIIEQNGAVIGTGYTPGTSGVRTVSAEVNNARLKAGDVIRVRFMKRTGITAGRVTGQLTIKRTGDY